MRKFALAFVLVGSFSVGGCQTISSVINPSTLAGAEKTLTVAHLAYNSLGQVIITATGNGTLKGATAAQVKIYYDKAGDALIVADKADTAANQTDLVSAVTEAEDAIASASQLVRK